MCDSPAEGRLRLGHQQLVTSWQRTRRVNQNSNVHAPEWQQRWAGSGPLVAAVASRLLPTQGISRRLELKSSATFPDNLPKILAILLHLKIASHN